MMRLWRVVVLVNLALAVGVGLGYLRWAREVRSLREEVERLRAEAPRATTPVWAGRGIVRAVVPPLRTIYLTHEALPGLMDAMTMGFEVDDPKLLGGLAPGDPVRFTVRKDGERLVLVTIQRAGVP